MQPADEATNSDSHTTGRQRCSDFKRNTGTEPAEVSEKLKYSKYYEHDGTLRAYANRAMVLAGSMTLLAFVSLGFAVYVRMQPPTIIRVSADGESSVISGRPLFHNQSLRPRGCQAVAAAAEL